MPNIPKYVKEAVMFITWAASFATFLSLWFVIWVGLHLYTVNWFSYIIFFSVIGTSVVHFVFARNLPLIISFLVAATYILVLHLNRLNTVSFDLGGALGYALFTVSLIITCILRRLVPWRVKSRLHKSSDKMIIFFAITFVLATSPQSTIAGQTVSKEVYGRAIGVQNHYFQLREIGEYEAAYNMFTERQRGNVSLSSFSDHWEKMSERFGKLTHLKNTKVTWYKNPEGSPEGLYAAIDFRASFERLPVFCGFLVWSIDEGYKLQREEMNFLENKSSIPMSDGEKEKAYLELSCR